MSTLGIRHTKPSWSHFTDWAILDHLLGKGTGGVCAKIVNIRASVMRVTDWPREVQHPAFKKNNIAFNQKESGTMKE
jgi:hypothetical protein